MSGQTDIPVVKSVKQICSEALGRTDIIVQSQGELNSTFDFCILDYTELHRRHGVYRQTRNVRVDLNWDILVPNVGLWAAKMY